MGDEPETQHPPPSEGERVVCVTGASGFIASHIVQQCLAKGYQVRGTVRDALNKEATAHLRALPGAGERLELFSASLLEDGSFTEAISGCSGVFHVASPLPVGKGTEDPENVVIRPAVEGTLNVLRSCAATATVRTVVVTSSMSAMAPVPEPALKTEEHWSDPEGQKERSSFYGAGKTLAERAAWDFVAGDAPPFRLVTVCPTMVLGPMLQANPNMTMQALQGWLTKGRPQGKCPNDSMSFVDVRDCAAQHLAAMELESATGRYMSLESSWHWNDLELLMRKLNPAMPESLPCDGEPCKPTQFDTSRQASLGVALRKVPVILADAADELRSKGLLG